jgi:SnoaL-like domain
MSDENEIISLVHLYARLLDAGDVGAVSALFEHSTWRSLPNGSVLHGSEAVTPVYEQLVERNGDRQTKHLITNLTIEMESDARTATSHSYWTVLESAPGEGICIALSGQYTDTFQKIEDRWWFSDRLITVDLSAVVA